MARKATKRKPAKKLKKAIRKGAKKSSKPKKPAAKKAAPKKPAKPLSKLDKALKANAKEIDELIERGRPRGFVTDNEILYYFPKIEDNVELLDEIYDRLEKAGIKVIETRALIDFSTKHEGEKNCH